MELSYNQLEACLVGYLGVHPDRVGTFRSRIKQLQRLNFPVGVNVGRGAKMAYSGEHLFQLVTALELMGRGQPAQTATNTVRTLWPDISAGYGLAIRREFGTQPEDERFNQIRGAIYIRIYIDTFGGLYGDEQQDGFAYVEDLNHMRSELEDEMEREGLSFLLLCASDIMRGALWAAANNARIDNPAEDEEFADWHYRNTPYSWWMTESPETGDEPRVALSEIPKLISLPKD